MIRLGWRQGYEETIGRELDRQPRFVGKGLCQNGVAKLVQVLL